MQRKQCINIFIICSVKAWSNVSRKDRFRLDQVPIGTARSVKGMKKAILLEISWCEHIKEGNITSEDKKGEKGKAILNKEQYGYKIKCPRIYLGWY